MHVSLSNNNSNKVNIYISKYLGEGPQAAMMAYFTMQVYEEFTKVVQWTYTFALKPSWNFSKGTSGQDVDIGKHSLTPQKTTPKL